MEFTNPIPFVQAVKTLAAKGILPTTISSAELRDLDASLRRQSIFSAKNNLTDVLDTIKAAVGSVINPQQERREGEDQTTTVGFNPATAREAIRNALKAAGYEPTEDERGTIKDLASNARLDLVVKTNVAMAQNAGSEIEANADAERVNDWPAWELVRFEQREIPRGEKQTRHGLADDPENSWETRFRAAATESGDEDALRVLEETGRMMARKDSPLWESLGAGAGGYEDTLDNAYAPYAFNSGMDRLELSRDEAVEAGLIDQDEKVEPAEINFGNLFGTEDT